MTYDEATKTPGVGFCFDAPTPLPLMGLRSCHPLMIGSLAALVFIEMKICETQRLGQSKLSCSELLFHERDRFGVFAYSNVQVRFAAPVEALVEAGMIQAWEIERGQSHSTVALKPEFAAYALCADLVNRFIDIQTVAFETYWVPHIRSEDIHSMFIMDWSDPANPKALGVLSGIPGGPRFRIAGKLGFPPKDIGRIRDVIEKLPLALWEEILNTALRDAEVGRFRSAVMHACLGVESYVREVLTLNSTHVADKAFAIRTLKPLAEKKGCLPSLLGYSLDSAAAPSPLREHYQRIATLRDSVMHTGNLTYVWPRNSPTSVDVGVPEAVADHLDMALSLIREIADELQKKGYQDGQRGMVAAKVPRVYQNDQPEQPQPQDGLTFAELQLGT